jgi:cytochrome b involved in lipid metabolism
MARSSPAAASSLSSATESSLGGGGGRADYAVSKDEQEQPVTAATSTTADTANKALSAASTAAMTDMMVDGSTRCTSSSAMLNKSDELQMQLRCDACPLCNDVCDNPHCRSCQEKSENATFVNKLHGQTTTTTTFTLCQVRRHNHAGSAWVVAGKNVYDVTSYLDRHPAGSACILSIAGGQCNAMSSLKRHKKYAQRKWEMFRIGTLKRCDKDKLFRGSCCCA